MLLSMLQGKIIQKKYLILIMKGKITIYKNSNRFSSICYRVLLSSVDELRKTDMTEHALEALSRSKIRNVHLVGRRGPLQAAFAIKELREILNLPNVDTVWREQDFTGVQGVVHSLPRPKRRIAELMLKNMNERKAASDKTNFLPVFFRSPKEVKGSSSVESVDFTMTKLVDNKAVPTGEVENIPAQLVCRSIGYKSISVDDSINFDEKREMVKNVDGRVLKKDSSEPDPGLYVAGWLATGPSGVILTTMNNAFGVAQTIIDDIRSGAINIDSIKPGIDPKERRIVTWQDWQKIDEREIEDGKNYSKPREKILNIEEMMKIVDS